MSKANTWYRGVKDDRQTLSMYSEHVYKDSFGVVKGVMIYYCAIFRCNANNIIITGNKHYAKVGIEIKACNIIRIQTLGVVIPFNLS